MLELAELETKSAEELRRMAQDLNIGGHRRLRKGELARAIAEADSRASSVSVREGVLEVLPDGRGYLRTGDYTPDADRDVYVADTQIKRFRLRTGDSVQGPVRPPKDNERYFSLLQVQQVNGRQPEEIRNREEFETLTPIYPVDRLFLETDKPSNITGRFLDLVTPIGKGQRGLIISPPKAGKTTIIKQMANALTENYPDLHMIVLLVDERPEEVTDIARSVDAEVASSTFDEQPDHHMKVAEMVLARAKRLVECGEDVVVLLDSITRLARASNLTINASGRTLSGGLDPTAMYRPKRFFGAARNVEEGGSLTILATILVDTGSRMDEMIYEEFKATGNMDLVLMRDLAEKGIFPAIDIQRSNTRHQELLFTDEEMQRVWQLRRALHALNSDRAAETLLGGLRKTKTNMELLVWAEATFKGNG